LICCRKCRRNRSGAESIAMSMFGVRVIAKLCWTALRMTRSSSKALRTPSAIKCEISPHRDIVFSLPSAAVDAAVESQGFALVQYSLAASRPTDTACRAFV